MDKKQISEHLLDALTREDLHMREAAKFLNLNPCYVSMARNPNSWDSMGKTPWLRLEEWHLTREKISAFQIPEGEEIWKPKEKPAESPKKGKDVIKYKVQVVEGPDEHSPENINLRSHLNSEEIDKTLQRETVLVDKGKIWNPLTGKRPDGSDYFERELKPDPINHVTETARLKVALDIEINLVVNGQKVQLR